jgi:hypothetical protein
MLRGEGEMSTRDQFQKLLDRKQQEINELQLQIEKARAYMQAIQDSMKFLPKDNGQSQVVLRPGSALARAQDVLRKAGKPLHITEILKALNEKSDKRVSLSGSLSAYVRNGQIFTRPAPNTFGLVEANKSTESSGEAEEIEIPEDFGDDK